MGRIHLYFIVLCYRGGMAEEKGERAAEQEQEPGNRPPWWTRFLEWTEFRKKTGWQWLELLSALAIPVVLALFTYCQAQQQDLIEAQRAESARMLEERRAQDEALQAYLDQMGHLLLEKNLPGSEEDSEEARRLGRV